MEKNSRKGPKEESDNSEQGSSGGESDNEVIAELTADTFELKINENPQQIVSEIDGVTI
jgi:hypothetical protein